MPPRRDYWRMPKARLFAEAQRLGLVGSQRIASDYLKYELAEMLEEATAHDGTVFGLERFHIDKDSTSMSWKIVDPDTSRVVVGIPWRLMFTFETEPLSPDHYVALDAAVAINPLDAQELALLTSKHPNITQNRAYRPDPSAWETVDLMPPPREPAPPPPSPSPSPSPAPEPEEEARSLSLDRKIVIG